MPNYHYLCIMKLKQFLKDWTLPVAIAVGTVVYLLFYYVPFLDTAGDTLGEFVDVGKQLRSTRTFQWWQHLKRESSCRLILMDKFCYTHNWRQRYKYFWK